MNLDAKVVIQFSSVLHPVFFTVFLVSIFGFFPQLQPLSTTQSGCSSQFLLVDFLISSFISSVFPFLALLAVEVRRFDCRVPPVFSFFSSFSIFFVSFPILAAVPGQ